MGRKHRLAEIMRKVVANSLRCSVQIRETQLRGSWSLSIPSCASGLRAAWCSSTPNCLHRVFRGWWVIPLWLSSPSCVRPGQGFLSWTSTQSALKKTTTAESLNSWNNLDGRGLRRRDHGTGWRPATSCISGRSLGFHWNCQNLKTWRLEWSFGDEVWHGGTYISLGFAFGDRLKGGYPLVAAWVGELRKSRLLDHNECTDRTHRYIAISYYVY